ncbi:hypothetical protein FRC17_000082 [Serendipita sp. 399]|nr:hypothetical protein FRC17_000082 [Serendipita sp. 399]
MHCESLMKIMDRQTTTQVDSTTAQDIRSLCFISKLPKEVLLTIFAYLRQEPRSPRCVSASRNRDLHHVSLVCRQWNSLAAHICYQSVQFYNVQSVLRFRRMLQDSPHIRKIVKTLVFPARLGRTCPPELLDAFEEITNLVDDISTLSITLRCVEKKLLEDEISEFFHVLPIDEGRHSDLRDLSIYGDGTILAKFPVGLTSQFVHIKWLGLKGVFLSEPVLADTIPALPKLFSFTSVSGNTAMMMDDWLLSCPKLEQVAVTGHQPPGFSPGADDPPMRVLVHGNLNYWCLSGLGETKMGKWLASCESVRSLLLDWGLFSSCYPGLFPPVLYRLSVEISSRDVVSLDAFKRNFGKNPICDHLTVTMWRRNKTFEYIEGALRTLCADSGVTLMIRDRSGYIGDDETPLVSNLKQVFKVGPSKQFRSWEMART